MLTVREAVEQIIQAASLLPVEAIPLVQAAERISRETIVAPFDTPRFTNSAMDGYAVRAADLLEAKPGSPTILTLGGRVTAGEGPVTITSGTCARVFTG